MTGAFVAVKEGMILDEREPELPFLVPAQPLHSANPFNAIDTSRDAVIGQTGLQVLGALGFPRPLVRRREFGLPNGQPLANMPMVGAYAKRDSCSLTP